MKSKVEQSLAPNHTDGGFGHYSEGADAGKLHKQMLPDNRVNDYPQAHDYADSTEEMRSGKDKHFAKVPKGKKGY